MDDYLYFTDQHYQVREMVRQFSRTHILPVAPEPDRTSTFPANSRPGSRLDIARIRGVGPRTLAKFADELLKLIGLHAARSSDPSLGASLGISAQSRRGSKRYVPFQA